jgi:thioredoxin-like negative regulator of GroEL
MNVENKSHLSDLLDGKFSGLVYFYTPICGTCQIASKMLAVIEKLFPQTNVLKIDVNYQPLLAEELKIESVPCLLVLEAGRTKDKIYAFKSVTDLFERIT